MPDPIIEIQNVTKHFGGKENGTLALQDVSLTIQAGEFVALIGPSGCGKSTLLRLIGDLLPPSEGTLRVKGKSPEQARRDRDYGIVFQAPVLYDWRTVAKNVELPLEVMRVARSQREQRAGEMLELVGLTEFRTHYPRQLSGGMQQRVSIARALSFKPSILLMDEPFGALDEMTRERLNQELLNLWSATQTTVVFVTHSIPEAVFLSSRVVVMSPRPGHVQKIIANDLPHPRDNQTRASTRYFELITQVRDSLREG